MTTARVTELNPADVPQLALRDVVTAIEQNGWRPDQLFSRKDLLAAPGIAEAVETAAQIVLGEAIKASRSLQGKGQRYVDYMANALTKTLDVSGMTITQAQPLVDGAITAELQSMQRLGVTLKDDAGAPQHGPATPGNPLLPNPAGSDFQARMKANPLLQP